MNERIKQLILEAGFPTFGGMYVVSDGEELERFAELVRADEREACAQIAFNAKTYIEAAAAIRARGEK